MKVAILFWGLTRSLKYTHESMKQNVFDVLKLHNIQYNIYIHTYKYDTLYNNKRAKEINIRLDHTEYKLLSPDFFKISLDSKVRRKIKFNKYMKHGSGWRDVNTLHNFVMSMYSKYQVTKLLIKNKIGYDKIIFMRPDVRYLNKLDVSFIKNTDDNVICIPNFHLFGKYMMNDRFAICSYDVAVKYGTFFKKLKSYSQKRKLHSETLIGYYIKKYKFDVKYIDFYFNRVRADGIEMNDF